ncbi:hypothetical protein GEMRC1_005595 [Eukaryota sp. GEM-RC1]
MANPAIHYISDDDAQPRIISFLTSHRSGSQRLEQNPSTSTSSSDSIASTSTTSSDSIASTSTSSSDSSTSPRQRSLEIGPTTSSATSITCPRRSDVWFHIADKNQHPGKRPAFIVVNLHGMKTLYLHQPYDDIWIKSTPTGILKALNLLELFLKLLYDENALIGAVLDPRVKNDPSFLPVDLLEVDPGFRKLNQLLNSNPTVLRQVEGNVQLGTNGKETNAGKKRRKSKNGLFSKVAGKNVEFNVQDELRDYFSEGKVNHDLDPVEWWKNNQEKYPKLSCIAKNYLSIQTSSAPS